MAQRRKWLARKRDWRMTVFLGLSLLMVLMMVLAYIPFGQ